MNRIWAKVAFLCLLSYCGSLFSQRPVKDSMIYRGIPLHNFYEKPVKKLLKEAEINGMYLNYCNYKFSGLGKISGISLRYDCNETIEVHFLEPIHDILKGIPCENKRILKSKISYYVLVKSNGDRLFITNKDIFHETK